MSGLRTSAMAGIGVNWRPLGFTVAGEGSSAAQGEEVTSPRLKGLEGGPGRTNTALGRAVSGVQCPVTRIESGVKCRGSVPTC